MKFIKAILEYVIFLFFLSGLMIVGSLTVNAAEQEDYNIYSYENLDYYKEDNGGRYTQICNNNGHCLHLTNDIAKNHFTLGYNDTKIYTVPFSVSTNATDQHYIAVNKILYRNLRFYADHDPIPNSGYTYFVQFYIYALSYDPNDNITPIFNGELIKYDVLNDVSVIENGTKKSCTVSRVAGDPNSAQVICPVYNHLNGYYYAQPEITINRTPFSELKTDSGKRIYKDYAFGIRNDFKIIEYTKPTTSLKVETSVDKATLKLEVSKTTDIEKYVFEIDGREKIESSTNTIEYDKLSNGTYTAYGYAIYSDGSQSMHATTTFTMQSSPLPVAKAYVVGNEHTITIDGSQSYSVATNSTIKSYYFKINDGNWMISPSPIYNFVNKDYGTYMVQFKVVDSIGQESSVQYFNYVLKEPTQTLWENMSDFFTKDLHNWYKEQVDYFFETLVGFIFPSDEFLSAWFYNLKNSVEKQFGFLSYPVTWTLTFLERFYALEDTGTYVIRWADVKVPNFDAIIIRGGSFDLASLLQNPTIRSLHDLYLMCLDGIIVFLFLKLCMNTINRVFGGSVQEDERFSDNVSVTFDNSGMPTSTRHTQYINKSKRRRLR